MRNLLLFIYRHHPIFLFVLLESIGLIMLGRFNDYHEVRLYGIRHAVIGGISDRFDNLNQYLKLHEENQVLVADNTKLYNRLYSSPVSKAVFPENDTITEFKYTYLPARVVNNSTNKQYNYITLNVGRRHGVEPEMGVMGPEGIIGIVNSVSYNYSSVISVLNRDFFPNARIVGSEYFGYIQWEGDNYQTVYMKDIPLHASFSVGDSIVTSGYSTIFPPDILIGTIQDSKVDKGLYYKLEVSLATDFKKLNHVMVIDNLHRLEQQKLEAENSHD